MSTLILRAPSRAAAEHAEHWTALPCAFAVLAGNGAIEREGMSPLAELGPAIERARQVRLIVAASDVTMLRTRVPPLSAPQLQRALPHLVEDQLLADPAECLLVAGPVQDGVCTVVVAQRSWLELLAGTLRAYGAKAVAAVPAQLCLPVGMQGAAAAVSHDETEIALRVSAVEGGGMTLEAGDADEVLTTVVAMAPERPITLYVPAERMPRYQAVLSGRPDAKTISLEADQWSHWIAGSDSGINAGFNLLGENGGGSLRADWRRWSIPVALAALLFLINIFALNIEWWRLRQQADQLRAGLVQTYRAAFPQDTVIVDPVLQMQRKLATATRAAGEPGPDDFLGLLARFGTAWSSAMPGTLAGPSITHVEYRGRNLIVSLRPDGEANITKLRPALAAQRLAMTQTAPGTWQIGSAP